jgi:oxygen-independent coproporphyrinogen-3 oxidase
MANDAEITLEANPASADAARFADYRAAGVNRVSLGVQALNDADLKKLGRLHDVAEAKAALKMAMGVFGRVSLDLIYARPDQSDAQWRQELREAIGFGTEHLSLYQLTIEPETPYALLHRNGQLTIPDDDMAAGLYETTQELTDAAGLPAYEISNHARRGAESRHNLIYWRYGDYLGIGAGAHQRVLRDGRIQASRRHRAPEEWLRLVEAQGHAAVECETLSPQEVGREAMLMGLRLTEGIDPSRIEARAGLSFAEVIDPTMLTACLEENYLLWSENNRLCATDEGLLRLDSMLPLLLR